MDANAILFYVLAGLTGASALAVVVSQNIVRAATWLLFALAGTAGVFFLLGAYFVGTTQLLVYVGGTLVLVVFGVMLTAQGPFISMKISVAEWAIALTVGMLFYGLLAICLLAQPLPEPPPGNMQQVSAATLGEAFLGLAGASPHADLPVLKAIRDREVAEGRASPKEPGKTLDGTRTLPEQPDVSPDAEKRGRRSQMSYLLPFEIVSVHLLVVLIGAAYLARAKRRRGAVA
jgi:NADH-quinone oxidoreductase subunit J